MLTVEKDDGCADKAPRYSVQAHIDPEYEQKPRYVVKRHIPHVGAHPEGSGANVCCGEGGTARLFWADQPILLFVLFFVSSAQPVGFREGRVSELALTKARNMQRSSHQKKHRVTYRATNLRKTATPARARKPEKTGTRLSSRGALLSHSDSVRFFAPNCCVVSIPESI